MGQGCGLLIPQPSEEHPHGMKPVQFRFQCKPLPKPEYESLTQLRKKLGLTTWQAVIVVIRMAQRLALAHPEALTEIVHDTVSQHPDKAVGS